MKDILTEIVAHKREELAALERQVPVEELRRQVAALPPKPERSMRAALAASDSGIIAEFKRKSPSKGWIHEGASPADVVPAYEAFGASALSVLTDEKFFGGTLADIEAVRPLVSIPILRKDFIVSERQLLEARLSGADAALLIAACLPLDECRHLAEQAHALGLEILLEVHSPEELAYVECRPDMLGVNNRNLGTFVTDVQNSFRLAEALRALAGDGPDAPLLVSESGISRPETVRSLRAAGYRGFLMGEAFMKQEHPGEALRQFIGGLR